MKNKLKFIIVLILLIGLFATSTYADTPLKKLGRGLCNIVTSPLEAGSVASRYSPTATGVPDRTSDNQAPSEPIPDGRWEMIAHRQDPVLETDCPVLSGARR